MSLVRPLAWLLQRANAHPPTCWRREFYDLKDRLCRRYGAPDGEDVQHIVHACWGYEEDGGCVGRGCRRCGGSGIWDEKWIRLERWKIAGRVFHRPAGPCAPRAVDYIEGRIRHDGVSHHDAREAAFWLALLAGDWRLFWRLLWHGGRSLGFAWHRHPMLALQALAAEVRQRWPELARCHCGRLYRRKRGRSLWFVCRRCAERTWASTDDMELPF